MIAVTTHIAKLMIKGGESRRISDGELNKYDYNATSGI